MTDGCVRTHAGADAAVIDLWSTAYVFRPGHRLRVHVAASSHPRWDINPLAARLSVYHDITRPSRIELPVI